MNVSVVDGIAYLCCLDNPLSKARAGGFDFCVDLIVDMRMRCTCSIRI